ncbi:tail fiber domain-containing protein [Leifsonia virtsii]|uniref:Tail fiber domain-containing protein n=1 Tax=Leifsonia virtsii TaxID=3035915 RepID=A0ABT8J036_9MICO|nr:tail fiber domain-containing protein [Leifsonia virtsii]MDN4598446.1 tail fiber domain-containing protein [Leifsonia virtsii]
MPYSPPPGNGFDQLIKRLEEVEQALRTALRPTGTSVGSLVKRIDQTLADIVAQVNSIATNWMAANAYTRSQVDSKIASPGDITPGNVTASGRVVSQGIIGSPGTKANTVTVGYSAVYIDSAGNMGGNTSTRRSKTNIEPLDVDLDALLALGGYRFQRILDVLEMGEAAPWQSGFMAEEVEPVAPLNVWHNEDGQVEGVRYEELVVPLLLAVARERRERLAAEEALAEFQSEVLDRLKKLEEGA